MRWGLAIQSAHVKGQAFANLSCTAGSAIELGCILPKPTLIRNIPYERQELLNRSTVFGAYLSHTSSPESRSVTEDWLDIPASANILVFTGKLGEQMSGYRDSCPTQSDLDLPTLVSL